jgi:hypothetical protein
MANEHQSEYSPRDLTALKSAYIRAACLLHSIGEPFLDDRLPEMVLNFYDRGVKDPGMIAMLAANRLRSVYFQESGKKRIRTPVSRQHTNLERASPTPPEPICRPPSRP